MLEEGMHDFEEFWQVLSAVSIRYDQDNLIKETIIQDWYGMSHVQEDRACLKYSLTDANFFDALFYISGFWNRRSRMAQIVDQGWHLQRIDLCSALCTRVLHLEQFYIQYVNNITWYNGLQMDGAQRPPASTANGGRGEGFSIPNLYSPNRVILTWHNGLWLDLSKLVLGSLLL